VGTLEEICSESCAALVLVLPAEAAGSLSRSALLSAAACATQHLSIVHQTGLALADAVARRPRKVRRTRLARLLSETLG
jgi:exodeoxyribonuclease V alpha subunit